MSEQVRLNYSEIADSRYVAKPVNDLLFSWVEACFVENLVSTDKDEGFSKHWGTKKSYHNNHQQRNFDQLCVLGEHTELFCCSTALWMFLFCKQMLFDFF